MPGRTALLGRLGLAELLGAAAVPQGHPQHFMFLVDQLLGAEREAQGKGRRRRLNNLLHGGVGDGGHLGLELGQALGPLGAGLLAALQQGLVEIKGGGGTWRRLHPPARGGGHRRHCGTGARLPKILAAR